MEVPPENEGEEYEDHYDETAPETAPYYGRKLNTIMKIFANTMFHSTSALRTILAKTIMT